MLILVSLSLICVELFAQDYCIPHRFTDSYYFRSKDIQHDKDIVYGQALDYKGETQALDLDIFYPHLSIDKLKKRPLIMLFHGGGGDKTKMYKYCPLFAERGFVVSTINFRVGYVKNPDETSILMEPYRTLQDAHAALRFLVRNSKEYGIDTNAVFVGGESGGALTSLGLAYMCQQDFDNRYPKITESLGRMDNSTNEINTKFSIRGVVDMWGQIPDTSFISIEEVKNIPIIMFHGTADSSRSPYNKSVLIAKRFQHLDGCYQLHKKTGAGHGEDMTKYYISAKASCFIKSVLCEQCTSLEKEIDNHDLTCDNVLPFDRNPKERSHIKVDRSLFTLYVGSYTFVDEDGKKQKLILSNESGHLYVQDWKSGFKAELFPESEKDFFLKEENAQITFNIDKNEKVNGLTIFIDAKEIISKRIK